MKVESQKAGDCRVKLVVNVSADETRPDFDKIIGEYVSHGRIPGFRPGKAPRAVIERRYQREIDEDVRRTLVTKFHRQAITEEKLNVANIVDVSDILFSATTGISFVLTVDLVPVFKLPKYHKLPVKINEPVVDEGKVKEQLNGLRRSLTRHEATEGAVAAGDMVQINYTATCGGKPLAEAYPDSGQLAGGTDFWTQAADPEFVPGLAAVLVGLKAGESTSLKVTFPKDYALESLRGVKAVYAIDVKAVRAAIPPADEEVAKQFGFDDLAALEARIRDNVKQEAAREESQRQQQEIADYLLKKCDFALPQSVVAAETQRALRMILGQFGNQPGAAEYIEKNRETLLNNASTTAVNHVRLNYIFEAIATEEKIEVTAAEIDAQIQTAAHYYAMRGEKDMTPAKLRERLEANDGLRQLRQDVLNSKVIQWLIDDAKA